MAGVLGGMGPLATVDFLAKVIRLTPAARDQDHLPMVVLQLPQIPDRSTAILAGSDAPFATMLLGLQSLRYSGAEFIVIPCNSAHHWYERLANAQPLKILNIADAVSRELQRRGASSGTLGILATRGTIRSGFYATQLENRGAKVSHIDEGSQQLVDEAIAAVKAGHRDQAAHCARNAANRLLSRGADTLVLACTELPVALNDEPILSRCIDSTLELARSCIAESALEDSEPH